MTIQNLNKKSAEKTKLKSRKRVASAVELEKKAEIPNQKSSASESKNMTQNKTDLEAPLQAPVVQAGVELFPHGITVGTGLGRPILILKDKAGVEVLPVWMHPLDAGVALAELSSATGSSPHMVTRRALEMMGLVLESCNFVEIIGHHQFVDLKFCAQSPSQNSDQSMDQNSAERIANCTEIKHLRVRADEAMSFCLQARARFYCSKDFMVRCRALDADLTSLEQNLTEGQLPVLQAELENSSKKHPYVM